MATQIEVGGPGRGYGPRRASDGEGVAPTLLVAALVATLEQSLGAARRLLVGLERAACAELVPAAPCPARGGLSRRECEVVGLLAGGRSNREIARALCLSPRTVQRHIANIYPKIGAHNRADATAYALRHGLG